MNKFSKKLLSVVLSVSLLLGCAPFAFAAESTTFDVNNIKYEVTGENTVAVISNSGDDTQHSTYTGDITIPATVENGGTTYNVTEIGAIAFEQSTVTKVTLPTSITKIGNGAFYQCTTVTEIVLNEGLLEIDTGAFNDCTSLAILTIPSTVTTLGRAAFGDCEALTSLYIPKSVTSGVLEALADTTNEYPHLDAVTIEEGGTYSLQDGILYEGNDLVYRLDYNKTVIDVRDGVTEIPDYAFGSAITIQGRPVVTSVTLPSSVTTIGEGAFQGADITSIDLTNVTSIGMNAFKGCDNLTDVTWPTNLSTMGESAFAGCSTLKNININGSLNEIPDSAFEGCAGLKSVVLPDDITRIGSYAFTLWDAEYNNSDNLSYINIPASVTSLGSVFLGGLVSETNAALIFKRTTLPTFEVDSDDYGALDGISPEMEMGTPTIYYPAEARSAYEESTDLQDLLPKDESGAYTGAYGLTLMDKSVKAGDDAVALTGITLPTGAVLSVTSDNAAVEVPDATKAEVKAVSTGSATITVTMTVNGFTLAEDTCTVNVLAEDKEPAVPVTEEPKVEVPEISDPTEKTNLENAVKQVEGDLSAATSEKNLENTVTVDVGTTALNGNNATKVESGETVTIVTQSYLNIRVTEYNVPTDGAATMKLSITPMYRTVATTANMNVENPDIKVLNDDGVSDPNAVQIGEAKELTNVGSIELTIPLTENFAGKITDANQNFVYVTHTKDGAFVANHKAEYDSTNKRLTFTNDKGFSDFEIRIDERTATLDFPGDTTADRAYTPADVGTTLPTAEQSGKIFDGWTFEGITGTYKTLTDDLLKQLSEKYQAQEGNPKPALVATAVFHTPSSGGGSSSSSYTITVADTENGTVTAPKSATKNNTVTVTVKPDEGYVVDEVVVTDKDGKTIEVTEKNGKFTFKMPGSKVTVEATFVETVTEPVKLPFTDVPDGSWYEDGVRFAYVKGMMAGTSATTFAPDLTTSRGMIVTMLYRLEDSPAAGVAGFDDVAADAWYADAVAWAAENGIVGGYGNGKFGPNDPITREQMATILYRYAQAKGYDTTARADLSGYTDAASISGYAVEAISWANAEGLVNGTSATTLTPGGSATRAQVAVILMRFCENVK